MSRPKAWAESKLLELMGSERKAYAGQFEIFVRRGRERVVAADDLDLSALPEECVRQKPAPPPELDKNAAKALLEDGVELVGVWVERGPDSIRVR